MGLIHNPTSLDASCCLYLAVIFSLRFIRVFSILCALVEIQYDRKILYPLGCGGGVVIGGDENIFNPTNNS